MIIQTHQTTIIRGDREYEAEIDYCYYPGCGAQFESSWHGGGIAAAVSPAEEASISIEAVRIKINGEWIGAWEFWETLPLNEQDNVELQILDMEAMA